MREGHASIAGMMVVVAVLAVDTLVLMKPALFAGGYLVGLALQVGLASRALGGGRSRFALGFQATGWALLIAFLFGRRAFNQAVAWWPALLYAGYRSSLSDLSPETVEWLLTHFYVLDPNGNLTVIQMIGVLEVTWGLPMLVLAFVGGLVARQCPAPLGDGARGVVAEPGDR